MSESAGPIVSTLSKLSDKMREMIRRDVIETVRGMFPEDPVRLAGEVIAGAGTKR